MKALAKRVSADHFDVTEYGRRITIKLEGDEISIRLNNLPDTRATFDEFYKAIEGILETHPLSPPSSDDKTPTRSTD